MLPDFDNEGDLPIGIYQGALSEVIERFGSGTLRRQLIGQRLVKIYDLAQETKRVARFIIYGSFVTAKPYPKDVDIFLLMEDDFDLSALSGETATIFNHSESENNLGASIFWMRREAAMGDEQGFVEFWQTKRDGAKRGIVEVTSRD